MIPSAGQRFSIEGFAVSVYGAGLLGSRGLAWISADSSHDLLGGPMTFYGGFVLGSLCGLVLIRKAAVPLAEIFDRVMPSILVGLGVGRLGCLLNGDDYGLPVSVAQQYSAIFWSEWTMFGSGPGESVLRYATQLQESMASFAIAGLCLSLMVLRKFSVRPFDRLKPSQVGLLALFLSAANRFWNEFYRGDERPLFFGTEWSQAQGISFGLASLSLALWFVLFLRPEHSSIRKGDSI